MSNSSIKIDQEQIQGSIVNTISGPNVNNSDPKNPVIPAFPSVEEVSNKANKDGSNTIGGIWNIDYILSELLTGNLQVLRVRGDLNAFEFGNNSLNKQVFQVNNSDGLKIKIGNGTEGNIWHQFNFNPDLKQNKLDDSLINNWNNKLDIEDLNGFVYDVSYNSTNHQIIFFQKNKPNIVIDLPIEQLIRGVQLVGNNLVFTFENGTTTTVPMNTLLVGVIKKVNGLIPNSQGEIIINLTDIPGLSSALDNKANKDGSNLSNLSNWQTWLGINPSGYVPYVGATSSVDLGPNQIYSINHAVPIPGTNASIFFGYDTYGGDVGILFEDIGGKTWLVAGYYYSDSDHIVFGSDYNSHTTAFKGIYVNTQTNNVGINKKNPEKTLDVVGGIQTNDGIFIKNPNADIVPLKNFSVRQNPTDMNAIGMYVTIDGVEDYIMDYSYYSPINNSITFNNSFGGIISFRNQNDYLNEVQLNQKNLNIGVRYDFTNSVYRLYVNGAAFVNGLIDTQNHGRSDLWYQGYRNTVNGSLVSNLENVRGIGFSNGSYLDAPYFYHDSGRHIFLATQSYVLANYASVNEINNIYDQLGAKANTRLSNVVWTLSPSEQADIKNKLGIFDVSPIPECEFIDITDNHQMIYANSKSSVISITSNYIPLDMSIANDHDGHRMTIRLEPGTLASSINVYMKVKYPNGSTSDFFTFSAGTNSRVAQFIYHKDSETWYYINGFSSI